MTQRFVVGVGMNAFSSQISEDPYGDGAAVLQEALDDAQLALHDLDLIVLGSVGIHGLAHGPSTLHRLGWTTAPLVTVENASATGSAAFQVAADAVASGRARRAAAVGIGSLGGLLRAADSQRRLDLAHISGTGLPPVTFALHKVERMQRYGETAEAALTVVEKNLRNASLNPKAQRSRALTMEEILESPLWVDPLRRVESCPIGDGAAAAIVSNEPTGGGTAVRLAAAVQTSDAWHPAGAFRPDPQLMPRLSRMAFDASGITARELDVVEFHEAFSVEELQYIEDIGLAEEGTAWRQLVDGSFDIGGRVAVSPSGGLIGRGHPGGATGLSQVVEAAEQLRGDSGQRQQPDARVAFVSMIGAGGVGYGSVFLREE